MTDAKKNWWERIFGRKKRHARGIQPRPEQVENAVPADPVGETRIQPPPKSADTRLEEPAAREQTVRAAEDSVPLEWNEGDVILDLYEVKKIDEDREPHYAEGGMGRVYRVHHKRWNVDLAVKCPKPDYFQTEEQKEDFTRECETWIELGLHPHIVSCHYVRTLGGVPRVFADYADGGNLEKWIQSGRLYEGGTDEALQRILDIAIQTAWGLGFAHDKGVIHQDVKPHNVMMTPKGMAKVTDFGLAKARSAAGESAADASDRSVLVSCGGMTPAYCSPEQADRGLVTRRTDIWSWAVSVLEMFTGEVMWMSGAGAGQSLEQYVEMPPSDASIPRMPPEVVDILRDCLRSEQDARPRDTDRVTERLQQVYHGATGSEYPRSKVEAAKATASGLNNRALSLLDLGRGSSVEGVFNEALQVDPQHTEAKYNRGLRLWRRAQISDEALLTQINEVCQSRPHDWIGRYCLGLIHLERGDFASATKELEQSIALGAGDEVRSKLEQARALMPPEVDFYLARSYVTSCSMSADGRLALIGSNGTDRLILWDVSTGSHLGDLEGGLGHTLSISLSRDGHCAVSGGEDGQVRYWDVANRRNLLTMQGHSEDVTSVCISADGRWALSGSKDNTLRLWECSTGRCIRAFTGHVDAVTSVSISADGQWAASGSNDGTARVWHHSTGRCVQVFEAQRSEVHGFERLRQTAVSMSENGRRVLSGSAGTASLWETTTGRHIRSLDIDRLGSPSYSCSVFLNHDGSWAVTTGGYWVFSDDAGAGGVDESKGALRVWELSTVSVFEPSKACAWKTCL